MTLLGVPPGVVGVEGTVGVSVAGGECAGRSCVVRLRIGGGLGRGAAARLRGRLVLRWRTVEAGFLVVVEEGRREVSVGRAAGAWSVETVGGGWERCAGRGRTAGAGALVIGRRAGVSSFSRAGTDLAAEEESSSARMGTASSALAIATVGAGSRRAAARTGAATATSLATGCRTPLRARRAPARCTV